MDVAAMIEQLEREWAREFTNPRRAVQIRQKIEKLREEYPDST